MTEMLRDKVALITGAAQGMGAACAKFLEGEGAIVSCFDVQPSSSGGTNYYTGDVTCSSDIGSSVSQIVSQYGRLDILIHAAGVLKPTGIFDMSEEEWDWVIDVNLKGAFLTSRAVAPIMRDQGYGRIIHFSSTAGKTISTIGGCHYTSAKHGVLGLTRALAKELAPFGITVNAVCPGLIDTEMVRDTISRETVKNFEKSFPISRLGSPGEVASLVGFLLSDNASYITGAAIDINGGDFLA